MAEVPDPTLECGGRHGRHLQVQHVAPLNVVEGGRGRAGAAVIEQIINEKPPTNLHVSIAHPDDDEDDSDEVALAPPPPAAVLPLAAAAAFDAAAARFASAICLNMHTASWRMDCRVAAPD